MYRFLQADGGKSWILFPILLLSVSILHIHIPLPYYRRSNHEGSHLGESPGHDILNLLCELSDTPGSLHHLGCNGCIEKFERLGLLFTGTNYTR